MPSVSRAQQRLMQAAEHGADFPAAKKIRSTMTHDQMHDFAAGSMEGKPEHAAPMVKNDVGGNFKSFRAQGMNEADATKASIAVAKQPAPKTPGHPNRHKNLGEHLHPRKDGKSHGSPKD